MKQQKQIMVVDDNLANLKNLQLQLSDVFQVILAKSGMQAIQICQVNQPDLILLDIDMPGIDGFETLHRFKKNPALSSIPVIFLTANHDSVMEARGLEAGAVDFVTKPFDKTILMHRIELHLRLSEYQHNLEHTVHELEDSIVLSFSEMIENRDKETGGHVLRTGTYMEMLCRWLCEAGRVKGKISEQEIPLIARAALLHDVGKIGVSDTILLKPDRLDDREFALMKKHTTIGAEILRVMYERTPTQHYLEYARIIAEGHHEKYDGSGYPFGIKGDEIPLYSRIMALADVYDALVADRVYRKAMSHDDAYQIIVSGKGTHFDPDVVDAFQAIHEQMAAESVKQDRGGGDAS
jgi:putative two-component system response regulator